MRWGWHVWFTAWSRAHLRDGDEHVAIDPDKINDGALNFGIIRAPLESLDVVVRCVYKPLINDMENWGEATSEQKNS